jgi:hypothetical protein
MLGLPQVEENRHEQETDFGRTDCADLEAAETDVPLIFRPPAKLGAGPWAPIWFEGEVQL